MSKTVTVRKAAGAFLFVSAWLYAGVVGATIVRFETTLGSIDVRLYDTATPLSVANFLNYSTTERFDDTIIHRSIPGFVIQGGGFRITTDIFNAVDLPADPPVLNEPGISNRRGTLAYAKLGGNPNSATREWFFNLADNGGIPPNGLDFQNGGFTVFGRVLGNGINVVDAIAALARVNAGGAFTDLPVLDLDKVVDQQNVFHDDAVNVLSVRVRDLPAGDYDFNGTVNTADYAVWRSTTGSTTNAAADGNGNSIVDAADYVIWRNTLGQTTTGSGSDVVAASLPEPATWALMPLAGWLLALFCGRRSR